MHAHGSIYGVITRDFDPHSNSDFSPTYSIFHKQGIFHYNIILSIRKCSKSKIFCDDYLEIELYFDSCCTFCRRVSRSPRCLSTRCSREHRSPQARNGIRPLRIQNCAQSPSTERDKAIRTVPRPKPCLGTVLDTLRVSRTVPGENLRSGTRGDCPEPCLTAHSSGHRGALSRSVFGGRSLVVLGEEPSRCVI